ncbi:MAG: DUF3667 domain-containing protein [Chitinophagaceae bacterium]|nr:MAG: DUF3667 domain-containing protein [Chitinophagaceae bacterium]
MMETQNECKYCKANGVGNFCGSCGRPYKSDRLSLGSILHEVFHFFTHLDHGFPFTFKRLLTSPGNMQREYIEGVRSKYQKPFSMFFICATIAALAIYWINLLLIKHFDAGDNKEAIFFNKYWVLFQVLMVPFFALITYLIFRQAKYNYGEILVFQLYLFSFLFIVLLLIHLLKFVFPHLQTRYIELPVIVVYTAITNLNFFKGLKKWVIIVLTILSICLCFGLASYLQDLLVKSFT